MIVLGVVEDVVQGVLPGGLFGVFYTQLATVVDGGELGIPKVLCWVSSLDRILLSLRRLRFTSAASPVR